MSHSDKKGIAILGSTGSIGRSTLDVLRAQPDRFFVTGLSAGRNTKSLADQVTEFRPRRVSVQDENARALLTAALSERSAAGPLPDILTGTEGAVAVATAPDTALVVSAMVGVSGLVPTYRAILAGKDIALANKETLVAAGELMITAARTRNVRLLPVDSEHNAIFQCLQGDQIRYAKRIWLTASGGPFFRTPPEDFAAITPDVALRHPTWRMGPKITIDSATMMNKGLEVIEAHWLFGLPLDAIRVLIHPQSTIHSLVEFVDGSILAQMGRTDMKLPIRYALNFPERAACGDAELDLLAASPLEFHEPEPAKFPCLALAYDALRAGGSLPAVLSGANEIAVEAFLHHQIAFTDIPEVIRHTMAAVTRSALNDIDQVIDVDRQARAVARQMIRSHHSA
ncbi:MAG TPA: 1-deoxy-D-xylulose-5-phosphate reductoisomerase [Acidobacteriota bacterium]|nr:1-deoxy-D-xylulose-5-phosphate reductoisomerase [Acidobacteriota bacterium]HPB29173.1 1-deoxy-D-xylulose-5-phosphate reductoisomerase [Acidobacteriota bacterium]HQO24440.1 1-deoxy-D-xylulose-5-phosphate reductoisomerase [Acidobacteriota bacterium]HQP73004.1 1-deoxy-D-xylulose-5-phosphate reductoisomerase [Acidobacteriota bacterium]